MVAKTGGKSSDTSTQRYIIPCMIAGHIAERDTSAIYIVGAREPGIARSMGLKTRATFEEALADAQKKFVGPNPNIFALPQTFKLGAVHLAMNDQ